MRRLPVYLLLDCSGGMSGEPLESLRQGLRGFIGDLKFDPQAIETAHISVITLGSDVQLASPLTDLCAFVEPQLAASGSVSFGAALRLLVNRIRSEVGVRGSQHDGDFLPLVFVFLHGSPTDDWQSAAAELNSVKVCKILGIALGANADDVALRCISDAVIRADNLSPDTIKSFFQWIEPEESAVALANH